MAALLDIVSRAFQLPLQHRSSLRGGLTGVWQPDSFWDCRSSPPALAPRLYWPKSSANGQQGRKDKDRFQSALLLLQRSIAMATHAHLGARSAAQLPPSWSPFAWLAGLCTLLAGEVAEGEAALSATASVMFGGHGSPAWPLAQSFMGEQTLSGWPRRAPAQLSTPSSGPRCRLRSGAGPLLPSLQMRRRTGTGNWRPARCRRRRPSPKTWSTGRAQLPPPRPPPRR